MAEILLDAGADPDVPDGQPLVCATQIGQPTIVEALLAAGADANGASPVAAPPLSWAAICGQVEATRLLLAYGANPDGWGTESRARTPLMDAAATNHEMVLDNLGWFGGHYKVAWTPGRDRQYIRTDWEPELEPHHQAEIARLLVEAGATVNGRTSGRKTALHYAAESGQADVIQVLLEHGADPNAVDDSGESVLDTALTYAQSDIVDLLREHGSLRGVDLGRANAEAADGDAGSPPSAAP